MKKITNFDTYSILWFFIVFSIGIFSIFTNQEINRDGILYLKQANIFNEPYLNINKIFEAHDFPLFSFLIYSISKLFGFTLYISSKVLNSLSFILLIIYYKKLISLTCRNEKNIFLFSLISILSFAGYIDDYLPMVLRDNCFIALFITSIYYFYTAIQSKNLFHLFLSLSIIFLASFFRLEGFIFLIFFLIYFLFQSTNKYAKFNYLFLFLFLFFAIYLLDLLKFRQDLYFSFLSNFDNNIINFSSLNSFIDKQLNDHSLLLIIFYFIFIFLTNFISGLGFLQSLFILFVLKIKTTIFRSNSNFRSDSNYFIFTLFGFILFLVFFNFIITGAISKRYFLCGYLLISLFIPYLLNYLKFNFFKDSFNKFYKYFLFIILFTYLSNIFIDKKMYDESAINYDKQAALWLEENLIEIDSVYFINDRIKFYLDKIDWLDISLDEAVLSFKLNYLVLDEPYSKTLLVKENNYQLIKTIPESKPKIFIFKKLKN